jgi:hypothetical protein
MLKLPRRLVDGDRLAAITNGIEEFELTTAGEALIVNLTRNGPAKLGSTAACGEGSVDKAAADVPIHPVALEPFRPAWKSTHTVMAQLDRIDARLTQH